MKSFLGFLFLLSPLIIVVVWAILTWRGIHYGRQYLKNAGNQRKKHVALVILLGTIWFGASFWYGGGRKFYYDAQVRELCAKDGGMKVYETVVLPPDQFEAYARRNWILPDKARAKSTDEYITESETLYYRERDPQFARTVHRVIRQSDGKVLGELVRYGRGGGDLPGPWHGSSFLCPDPTKSTGFKNKIFIKGE